ncbi:MAG: hypothetical protein HKN14_13265, partial [Marinicaulis sp.]|nr:hypothetical protein [Marinicaulis sp.]
MTLSVAYHSIAVAWSKIICERPFVVLGLALFATIAALKLSSGLSISTRLEDLMPASARSVQSLNAVLEKSGSFASIQIVAQSDDPKTTREFLKKAKSQIDPYDWVAYSQYSEDVEFLTRHRLLMLETEELEALEQDIKDAYPVFPAQKLAEAVGTDVTLS